MIHKLYVNIAGWTSLDYHFDKNEVIKTMISDNQIHKHDYYMIVDEDKSIPPNVEILRNQEEIDKYISAYNERQRLDNMSCVELKKEITKKIKIKKRR